jgi:hypothetical protein
MVKWPARLVLLGAAAVVGGCSAPKVPSPSAFYSAVDLQAVVEQCAPQGLKWGALGSGKSEGGSPLSYHRNTSFHAGFQGEQDLLDTIVQALKGELQKAVEAHGGRVSTAVILGQDELPWAVARRGVKQTTNDGKRIDLVGLSGFQLNYEVGATPGEILVTVTRNEVDATNPYPLSLCIDIFESGPAGQKPVVQSKLRADR